ncbi:MAG: DUF4224 domain-containing protein [Azoarcus sp.]|nr:DUF4224 domain-containing protein [Azoarcus sp.]
MFPWLTDAEIDDLCEGLKQPAAQARYLRGLGLPVRKKPNGRPLVLRSDVLAMSGSAESPASAAGIVEPNRRALIEAFRAAT